MEDQEVRPDEAALDGHDPELRPESEFEPTNADLAARLKLRVVLLSGFLAVLIVFGAVMTWLYLDRDRAIATKTAQLNAERTKLEDLQHHADDLKAQLNTAQATALDPQGYQLVKSCVWAAYYDRQTEQRILTQQPGTAGQTMWNLQMDPKTGKLSLVASPCDEAVKYVNK